MQNLINKEVDKWERPWNVVKFDNLYNRDERFFSLVIKGALMWLNSNLIMYNKPIRHFLFTTGSSYLYLENNDYEYTWCESSGEDYIYMETPRCVVSVGNFSIPTEELTATSINCQFERISTLKETEGQIMTYNAQMRRLPLEITLNLKYVFSTFNEAIIFIQELFEKVSFQQYYEIVYLGQTIKNSIEFVSDTNINLNQIDLTSKDVNQKTIEFDIKINTNLPIIDEKTQMPATSIISNGKGEIFKMDTGDKLGEYYINENPEI